MAKASMIQRNLKRQKLSAKFSERRKELKKASIDPNLTVAERLESQTQLQKLPNNSSPHRIRNRCHLSGRPRGYYRKFGLARTKLREVAMRGEIPGLVKSSW